MKIYRKRSAFIFSIYFFLCLPLYAQEFHSFPIVYDCNSYVENIQDKLCGERSINNDLEVFNSIKFCKNSYKNFDKVFAKCDSSSEMKRIFISMINYRNGQREEFYKNINSLIRNIELDKKFNFNDIYNIFLPIYYTCEKDKNCFQDVLNHMEFKNKILETPMFCDFNKNKNYNDGYDVIFDQVYMQMQTSSDKKRFEKGFYETPDVFELPTCSTYYCKAHNCSIIDKAEPHIFSKKFDSFYEFLQQKREYSFK